MSTICRFVLSIFLVNGAAPSLAAPRWVRIVPSLQFISDRVYLLEADSTFERGCFDPCQCIWSEHGTVRGTFRLMYAGVEEGFRVYRVEDVNWMVTTSAYDIHVTGDGIYRTGRAFNTQPLVQRLELDLAVGDQPVEHFDSGFVPAQNSAAIDLILSANAMDCFDTVFSMRARPSERGEIAGRHLFADSTFEQGCYDPCDCASPVPLPLTGTMGLIPLTHEPWLAEYAVVNVRWHIPGDNVDSASARTPVTGSGFWRFAPANATDFRQQLSLDLRVGDAPLTHFDSGWVPYDGTGPIDVPISANEMICFDTVMHVITASGK